jgi:ligand-binding SRPBCC domain-containing protein
MPVLEVVTFIAAPPERVFDCARDVGLHLRSMRATGERVVSGRAEGLCEAGDVVVWSGRHFGVRWTMTVKISGFERPRWFQDRMTHGPFAAFSHDHHFEAVPRGTRMYDVIAYRPPFGALGRIFDSLLLWRHMRRLLEERAEAIRRAAEDAAASPPATGPGRGAGDAGSPGALPAR